MSTFRVTVEGVGQDLLHIPPANKETHVTLRKMQGDTEISCKLGMVVSTSVIPALGRLRQEDHEFKDSLLR
jgi:hypothetical protein